MDLASAVTITAPSAVDGYGEIAVLNGLSSQTNFVGHLYDSSGFDGPPVRASMDDIVEGHGAVFGSFFNGPRSFTLEVALARAATWALSMARRDKLYRAWNAMAADGTLVWTESGGTARLLNFRREQPPRGPDKEGHVLLAGISADPRIYSSAESSSSPGAGLTNAGNIATYPKFVLTSPTNTITLTRSSPSPTETLTLTGLSGAGTVTVDFAAKTVTCTSGTASRPSAVSFPSSVWWQLQPGANTVSVSGATATSGVKWRSAWL